MRPPHVSAEADVIDAHDLHHPGKPVYHVVEGRKDRGRRPNADDPARLRDRPRVVGGNLPAMRGRC